MKNFVLGFIVGIVGLLVILGNMTMESLEKMTSKSYKKKLIDKIEYLLLGYNTRKIPPYRARYYANCKNFNYNEKADGILESLSLNCDKCEFDGNCDIKTAYHKAKDYVASM